MTSRKPKQVFDILKNAHIYNSTPWEEERKDKEIINKSVLFQISPEFFL